MAIRLIGTPSKVSQTNRGDLGSPGDFYEGNAIKKLGKVYHEKPIRITYETWEQFDKNISKDMKKEFGEDIK